MHREIWNYMYVYVPDNDVVTHMYSQSMVLIFPYWFCNAIVMNTDGILCGMIHPGNNIITRVHIYLCSN